MFDTDKYPAAGDDSEYRIKCLETLVGSLTTDSRVMSAKLVKAEQAIRELQKDLRHTKKNFVRKPIIQERSSKSSRFKPNRQKIFFTK